MTNNTNISTCVPSYFISPERLKLGRISVKSDVYSFGVVILEIVSGQSAWRSYTVNKMNLDDYVSSLSLPS